MGGLPEPHHPVQKIEKKPGLDRVKKVVNFQSRHGQNPPPPPGLNRVNNSSQTSFLFLFWGVPVN